MLCSGIAAYILLIISDRGAFRMVKQLISRKIRRIYPEIGSKTVDYDVFVEKERVNQMTEEELEAEAVVMQNVSKFYGKFCAVNQISVAIKK